MKTQFVMLSAVLLTWYYAPAQNFITARKALRAYDLDPVNNKSKLEEALQLVLAQPAASDTMSAAYFLVKGAILNEVATQIINIKKTGSGSANELDQVDEPALAALKIFTIALQKAQTLFEKKDALIGLQLAQANMYNAGIIAYEGSKYSSTYQNFNGIITAHQLLGENRESFLKDEPAFKELQYLTGLAALNANERAKALPIFEELYRSGFDKPEVYEALYKTKSEGSTEAMNDAYKYLEEGRRKNPDNPGLLFTEINHFLKLGKLDLLTGKLKSAIEKEPANVSLYNTLGNVYDNLYQQQYAAGSKETALKYFDTAVLYYNQALAKDPNNVNVIYSIGALYFNKAASLTQYLNELANDFSKDGVKKYNDQKIEIDAEFDKALPYFQQAESKNADDVNTLVALKEIFARKNDFATSDEFKRRLEIVQGGGKNTTSYFKK